MKYLHSFRHAISLSMLCTLFVGCKSETTTMTEDLAGAPELAAVQIPLTGSAPSEGMATEDDAIDIESITADELAQVDVKESTDAVELGRARGAIKRLNESLRDFLTPVVAMLRSTEPTYHAGALKMWGPVVRGATSYRFFLRKTSAVRWGWRLDARVADSEDDFVRVAAGEISVGVRERRGAGKMGFDLDALSTLDPTVTAKGKILVGFRHGELGSSVAYAVKDFARSQEDEGVDALLRAVHLENGFNRVRLAYRGNVEGTATDAEELVLARLRHRADLGGRSDALVLKGDVADGAIWVVSQCWSASLESTYREVRSCPTDGIGGDRCVSVSRTGDSQDCPTVLREIELPPEDANAEMSDDVDPNADVAPPNDIPEVEGDAQAG
jgi:hypothetical protein